MFIYNQIKTRKTEASVTSLVFGILRMKSINEYSLLRRVDLFIYLYLHAGVKAFSTQSGRGSFTGSGGSVEIHWNRITKLLDKDMQKDWEPLTYEP